METPKRWGRAAALATLLAATLAHAADVKLEPGQRLALTDGSYLALQGTLITLVSPTGTAKTFPPGATIRCDQNGRVAIWGTGGTTIWGTGGTAVSASALCRARAAGPAPGTRSEPATPASPARKFEDPTFTKGFEDPTFRPVTVKP